MSKRAFTHQGNIVYFCGKPLLTGRDEQEARYRAAELSADLVGHMKSEGFKTESKQDLNGWENTGTVYAGQPGKPRRYGFWWNDKEDQDLVDGLKGGLNVNQLAARHERDLSGITCRIDKLTGKSQAQISREQQQQRRIEKVLKFTQHYGMNDLDHVPF